ncbi:MAG: glycosyltransferase [Candidatus Omnitrophica bacterium]|nr:glycosyltransferase [Candidatus Omnitrophota bacterium]MBU1869069.1 glycosyltransferase [Candidatus Omnitrophota bacterium]
MMRIVLLTRTERPSGAAIAKSLVDNGKNIVAIVAEERSELLKKESGRLSLLRDSIQRHGWDFTLGRVLELVNIKLHFALRKFLPKAAYKSKDCLSIEEFVLDKKIPYYKVKDHNGVVSESLIRSFSPDIIVITNTRLIKKNILDIPKYGVLNLHGSLLPKYTGLDSIFWALFHGEKEIGATVHFVNDKLDQGDIVLQSKIRVGRFDNEKTLYRKAIKMGVEMMPEAVTQIEQGTVTPIPQEIMFPNSYSWPTKAQRNLLKKLLKERRKGNIDRKIRVLHIITRLIKGGAQENTLITILGLREKGYDVVLASGPTSGPEGEIESYARAMGVKLVIIPELVRQPSLYKDIAATVKIYNLITRHKFDIVHTHTSKAGIVGRLAAKLASAPIIVHTPHGHIFHSYFGPIKSKFYHGLEMVFSNFCDKIITLTDKCRDEHVKYRIASVGKFVTIHSGVRLDRFIGRSFNNEEVKSEFNIPLHKRVAGTVARLEPIKGVNYFVDSMKDVLDSVPDAHFLVVGDGSQREQLENRVEELGIDENVTFTGVREDVPRLLSAMDLFVLSSLNEGMGRVLVEAGVMAKPAVATKVSGIPELVKHGKTGILVEPRDTKELAQGIVELLSSPEKLSAMGENAKLMMMSRFSAERMVDNIDNLYKELLKR